MSYLTGVTQVIDAAGKRVDAKNANGDYLPIVLQIGPNMTAARAAYTGSDSSVIKLVGDSWIAPIQGYSAYGWLANMMTAAGCTTAGGLPGVVVVLRPLLGEGRPRAKPLLVSSPESVVSAVLGVWTVAVIAIHGAGFWPGRMM